MPIVKIMPQIDRNTFVLSFNFSEVRVWDGIPGTSCQGQAAHAMCI